MALASGIGAQLREMTGEFAFSETQALYVVTYRDDVELDPEDVPLTEIGRTRGDSLVFNGKAIALAELREAHASFFRDWMEA